MIRALALFIGLTLVGIFALLNWTAFTTPTPLSFGFTTVEAPLGIAMLGVVVFLSVLFTVWAISMQATTLFEQRRQNRELQAQRDLADKAEQSRFTELRAFLVAEMQTVATSGAETRALLANRLEHLMVSQRQTQEETTNTLAAYIGELEDRLERARVLPAEYEREELVSR
ncbi:MAG: hypothetical protein RLZZ618_1932 [Pseudomonadota bacterium]|jgi:uncharacterized integral membrane protein